jgi:hypothetical protein
MESSKESDLTYRAAKEFIKDNYPGLKKHFLKIWRISKKIGEDKEINVEKELGVTSFVSNDILIQMAQIVIPFLSGTFSAVIADVIWEKIKTNQKEKNLEIALISESVRVKLGIDKKLTKKLMPYILKEIEKEITSEF